MNIGALLGSVAPNPQVTRIGMHGALHFRSAIAAKALDLENVKLLGYDFAKL